jgi:rRNA-processing protein FCF1
VRSTTATNSASSSASRRPRSAAGRPLVLLDANAVFLPVRVGFPLDAEVGRLRPGAVLSLPASVVDELDRLVARGIPEAAAARALAARYPVVPAPGKGDDAVLRSAVRTRAWVVTADRALRERLTHRGVTVLSPRDRHRLEVFRAVRSVPRTSPRRRASNG